MTPLTNFSTKEIAVIGMGCHYPGASDLGQLWENILSKRCQFRQIPDKRLPLSEYYDPDPKTPDKTYGTRAAVIDGFEFDWAGKRIPKTTIDSTDIVHWLALEVASKALQDAGYTRETITTSRSGVILGNTLTGENTRAQTLRLRWPYVQKSLRAAANARNLPPETAEALVATMEDFYKSVFAPITEDSLAGGLSNTIAGRICNFFNFDGGGYTVDGACASSLIAVATACSQLAQGDLDLALAGGVDISLDTFELIGFAKTGALTAGEMTVYDRRASGFIPGEGCGFVVLKRLADAVAAGDYVYAVLNGWGISSDGKGGITAPSKIGQSKALRHAYRHAGYSPHVLHFIEGHGTGTPVGDRTELEGIALAMSADGELAPRAVGITSFKSLVGHTKAAAGVGGLIKAVIAVNQRIIPPTVNCIDPNPIFNTTAQCLYPVLQGEIYQPSETLRAGVSAMGFGGINSHITLSSGNSPAPHLKPSINERSLLVSSQETELFIFSASSLENLRQYTQTVKEMATGISIAEMVDLAAHLALENQTTKPVRAAIIASKPVELIERLTILAQMLQDKRPAQGEVVFSPQKDIWISHTVKRNRVAFLFPGQGSQKLNMARTIVERYPWARELLQQADNWLRETGYNPISQYIYRPLDRAVNQEQIKEWFQSLTNAEIAPPAICFTSLLISQYLERLGIKPVAAGGHSLGELTAFQQAGAYDEKTLIYFAAMRGRAMSTSTDNPGTMASMICSVEKAKELIAGIQDYVIVANINSPQQTVISGEKSAVAEAIQRAAAANIQTRQLAVANAFHSQMSCQGAEYLRQKAPIPLQLTETSVPLFSSMNGKEILAGLNLREHFKNHMVSQVNFISLIETIASKCDLMLEVGPGAVLSGLVNDISPNSLCFPLESKPGRDGDLNTFLGCYFTHGGAVNWEVLYENRLVRPFISVSQRLFIDNPCERPFSVSENYQPLTSNTVNSENLSQEQLVNLFSDYFTKRGNFLAQVISADLASLPSLSKIGQQNDNVPVNNIVTTEKIQSVSVPEEVSLKVIPQESKNVEAILVDLVVKQTGYPLESITSDLRLLDDLNLDSIKAGELVANAAKEVGVAGKIDTSTLANATLKEVVAAIHQALPPSQTKSIKTEVASASVDISQQLLDLVQERTGFPKNSLSMNLRFLDDLNLDSIKAADLIATIAKQVGVAGKIDPSTLANATLADVVAFLEKAQPAPQFEVKKPEIIPSLQPANWVRNWAIEYVPVETPPTITVNFAQKKILLVAESLDNPIVQALAEQLFSDGAQLKKVTYQDLLAEEHSFKTYSYYIAFLPSDDQPDLTLPLANMIQRLIRLANLAPAHSCVAYIQFGGGRFGSGSVTVNPEVCCAAGFARSLHLERPDLQVRVVDLDRHIAPHRSAKLVIDELGNNVAISTVGYDANLVRLVPQSRLQQPVDYTKRSLSWSTDDVILVTGGAKGITAECALAVAQLTKVKMALIGRSPANTPEIAQTLERFASGGITCRYYSCDLNNSEAVSHLLKNINTQLGQITGVIHGSGLNSPRKVEHCSEITAQAEVSPKLLGAYNILQALASDPPKLFVAFSSIIGVTGMPGNAWYAFANESLAIMLRRYQSLHPQTEVLCLAYSVWDEVGMGARLGSVKNLEKMGISAISPNEGVARFVKLFSYDPSVKEVVISSRLGGLDTWNPIVLSDETASSRFIEQVLYVEPSVELKVQTHLSLEKDLYIPDHIWRGSYLFPTVFGLEAMAQATAYVIRDKQPTFVRIENISLQRPIVVNPNTGVDIQIQALVMERDEQGEIRVKVGIRTEQTNFTTDHFSATFVLGKLTLGEKQQLKLDKPLQIDAKTDLYGDLLFQGRRFQRMENIYSLDKKSSVFVSRVQEADELSKESFAFGGSLLLGDPYLRDVLLQSVQLTIPQHICLPVQIDKIELFQNPSSKERVVSVLLQKREGREYISEVFTTDKQGYVLEKLTGYRLRILEEHPENPTAIELADPQERDRLHVQQILDHTFKEFDLNLPGVALGYAPNLQSLSKKERRQKEQPIVAVALRNKLGLELDFQIRSLPSGKPELVGVNTKGLHLSLSHCDRYCLCVVDQTPQGCDLELITDRSEEDWLGLLGSSRYSLVEQIVLSGDSLERAGTRIWSALEAIRKAFNGSDPKFSVVAHKGEGVLLKTQTPEGEYLVVTIPVQLTRPPERMIAIVVPLPQEKEVEITNISESDRHRVRYTTDGPQNQLVYEERFQASFKDSGSISRRVYFSQYFRWVGKIRELPMESIASQILADFISGDWGMVTNAVSLRVLGEATAYDVIQARAWVGSVVGSSFDTYIEFCKVRPDNSLERLAIAEVKATWVRLVSYGVPSPMPFPQYLQEYLEKFAPKQPATLDLKNPATLPLPPLPASLSSLDIGANFHQAPITSNRYGKLLRTEVFQTTLEESNLVGNVYYGNYFIWQGRIIDLFLYSVAPEYLRVSNPKGEMVCLYTRMDYLREAMPFDKIRVLLYVQSVNECGAVFNLEFFREQSDGSSEKLHVGQQEVIWVERLPDGTPVAAPWPELVLQALVEISTAEKTVVI